MILNKDKLNNHIVEWIKNEAEKRNQHKLLLYIGNESPEIRYLINICKKTRLEMFYISDKQEYIKKYKAINIDNNIFYEENSIIRRSLNCLDDDTKDSALEDAALECRLRTAMVNWLVYSNADILNAVNLSTLNKNEYELIRNYSKLEASDIFPLADLYRSEICELLDGENISTKNDLSYDELEWVSKQNSKNNIIVSDKDPAKHYDWGRYTSRQRVIISTVFQLEKASRFNILNKPICPMSNSMVKR